VRPQTAWDILKDEDELPPIDGIPESIRVRFGDAVNDLRLAAL